MFIWIMKYVYNEIWITNILQSGLTDYSYLEFIIASINWK